VKGFCNKGQPKKGCVVYLHGIKGFVIPTKSFVKIGITKIFCYNNKMFSSINKTFGCCSKFLVAATKKKIQVFVVPYFVAVTKPFFFHVRFHPGKTFH